MKGQENWYEMDWPIYLIASDILTFLIDNENLISILLTNSLIFGIVSLMLTEYVNCNEGSRYMRHRSYI